MKRVPVYELLDQRPVVDDAAEDDAASAAGGGPPRSVFRPLTGDECTIVLSRVRISPPPPPPQPEEKEEQEEMEGHGYGDYTCSAWLGDGPAGTAADETATVRLRVGDADCVTDRGLEAVLRSMAPGECREFRVGDGRGARVSGRVRLTAVRRSAGRARPDDRLRLAEAAAHRAAGNRLYGEGRHADAFHRFGRAARALIMVRDPEHRPRRQQYAAVCNNMAACQLRAGNAEHAHRLADKALAADPDNVKALVRRCRAAAGLRMWDAALADARRALALDPGNAVAGRYADEAVRGVRDQQAVYATMVKKMFSSA